MTYNPDIHNRQSIRLKRYDYSQAGLYFITICCHNRICRFGSVENGEMVLNDAGKIAETCWFEIPQHFPNAILHEYVVMPNHIHGIVELKPNNVVGAENLLPLHFLPLRNNTDITVGVENFQPLHFLPQQPKQNAFQQMTPRSIGSIVKGFKIGVTNGFGKIPILKRYGNVITTNI